MANSALALEYGQAVQWKSPSYGSQSASASPPSITVKFDDVGTAGLRDDQYPYNYLDGEFDCAKNAGKCAWAELQLANGSWVRSCLSNFPVLRDGSLVPFRLSHPDTRAQ